MRSKVVFFITVVTLASLISGCSFLNLYSETPSVNITSFNVLSSPGLAPRFKIALHIINPNRSALEIEGIYYSIEIEGHAIVEGVANNLPTIGGYDAGDIELEARANLVNSLRLIADLARQTRDHCSYKLKAKLSIGMLRPSIRVVKEGTLSLQALTH